MTARQNQPLLLAWGALRLFLSAAIWRITGARKFGHILIEALDSSDENLRMISGTLLARGGSRNLPLLRQALEKQHNLPMILTLIGDIGETDEITLLKRYAADEHADVAHAASDALRILCSRAKKEVS